MARVKVLLGDMTFFDEKVDGKHETIVHNVRRIALVKSEDLDEFCENSLDEFEGYLVPSEYKGKIVYELECMNEV
jgi:hypothetical protein